MVFETLVADLLNRFLGDFVDNLDASQLNIGIWGGNHIFIIINACNYSFHFKEMLNSITLKSKKLRWMSLICR